MKEPHFQITSKMVSELSQIERLYGRLQEQKLVPSLALKLAEENQILATHYSTSIEGNPLSALDVTNIVLGDQTPVTKSETEVKNYFAVLNAVFSYARNKQPINPKVILELHEMLMKGIDKMKLGVFRDSEVFIGHRTSTEIVVKHSPPFHSAKEIEQAIEELIMWTEKNEDIHPLIRAGIIHHEFAYIHPFLDGNGRMARILTAYFLLLHDYEVVKYFIMDDYYDIDRHQYSDMLHTADNAKKGEKNTDKTEWIEYFLEGIVNSLHAAAAKIEELQSKSMDSVTGEKRVLVTKREEDALQILVEKKAIKTQDIVESLSVTRQQAHSLLYSLTKKGLVKKFGKTKTSYYKLKKPPQD